MIANRPIGQAQVFKFLTNPTPYTEKLNFQLGVVKPKKTKLLEGKSNHQTLNILTVKQRTERVKKKKNEN